MDQERDTIGNDKSSRRERFWRENTPTEFGSGGKLPGRDMNPVPSNPVPSNPVHPSGEALPVLFELPDQTPEARQKRRESTQFRLHHAHTGPPASHVDPPSGNHSHLVHSGPKSPTDSDSPHPDSDVVPGESDHRLASPPTADVFPEPDHKIAAYHDDSPSWSDNIKKASWAARSAVVLVMLAMVTLAFFSGRGLRPTSSLRSNETLLSDSEMDADALDESTVVMIDDIHTLGDFNDTADQDILDAITSLPSEEMLPQEFEPASHHELPSYITNAPDQMVAGKLGEPSVSIPSTEYTNNQNLAGFPNTANEIAVPPLDRPTESIVAFREPGPTGPGLMGTGNTFVHDNLPSGMDDRLRLEDGLRYSDTPLAIGNFLEILKAWEETDMQSPPQ